ncbi:MAG: AmmeMemoRadiSam system radical SAM enzyme [Chloroflexi bacterium]|nr:MAG: AmmeMemoRadiSam system radical SAM enzyme [Chloroflexota bacterium]
MRVEALLYDKLPGSRVRCHVCQWRCTIGPGKLGVCKMRQNIDGVLYTLNYAQVSSAAVDPIEKKPLFHFFPGSRVFSLGTWGCNFHCKHCQNWQISCTDPSFLEGSRTISPQAAIEMTKRHDCQGIAWTYNEPTIWFEYTLDSAKLAKESNLYTVYVTNGYITAEALDMIGPYLEGYCVDVKGFTDGFHQELARLSHWRGILEVTERAKEKWGMHVEVVTNIIPTMNDDEEQLEGIATWIRDRLGELTPWHVTRFYPQHELLHLPPTPISTLERAWAIGKRVGLRFVYTGNVPGHSHENTICYSCGNLVMGRMGYQIDIIGVEGSKCHFCGADLNLRTGRL